MKQRTSRVVGVAVSDLGNQFYANLAAGIEQTLREADYQMILVSDNSDESQELACARTFLAMRAAGVIVTPADRTAAALLSKAGIPVIEVDRRLAKVACDAVVLDNERGGREATEHLLELGHTRIALLVADTDWTSDAGRLHGYVAAHVAHGADLDERLILPLAFHAPDAEERIDALLDGAAADGHLRGEQRARGARVARCCAARPPPAARHLARGLRRRRLDGDGRPGHHRGRAAAFEMGRRAARLLLRRAADPDAPRSIEMPRADARRARIDGAAGVAAPNPLDPANQSACFASLRVVTFSHENRFRGIAPFHPGGHTW